MRRPRKRWLTSFGTHVGLVALAILAGCRPAPAPPPVEVDLGIHHRARFAVPTGWVHFDHGRTQIFENGIDRLELSDIGVASPEGLAEALRSSRSLFRDHQWEDARALLDRVDPRRFFPEEARWKRVEPHWKKVRTIRRREGFGDQRIGAGGISRSVVWDVEAAYHDLLVAVSALPDLDLDTLARRSLEARNRDSLRDIASEEATSISGRPATVIKTWDRLSHSAVKLRMFVLSEGRLVRLETGLGDIDELEDAFELVRTSLELEPTQGGGGT